MKINTRHIALIAVLLLIADRGLTGCADLKAQAVTPPAAVETAVPRPASPAPTFGESFTDASDGGHAIFIDGGADFYSNITVQKTGSAAISFTCRRRRRSASAPAYAASCLR